jgi:hypothetical protein
VVVGLLALADGSGRLELRYAALALAGALIGARTVAYAPAGALGWLFLAVGLSAGLTVLSGSSTHPYARWADSWVWLLSYLLLPALLLVFPTGRPASRRWVPLLVLGLCGALVATAGLAWASWWDPALLTTDTGPGLPAVARAAILSGVLAVGTAMLAGLWCVTSLWRRSSGPERRMLGWAVAAAVLFLLATVLEVLGAPGVSAAAAAALPAAAIIAITRYGLYDIDLLLHRSLLYGLLSLCLLGVYAAVVTVLADLAPDSAAGLAAVATVLAAQPLRTAGQRRVDRYVYGERHAPYQVMSGLNRAARPPGGPRRGAVGHRRLGRSRLKLPGSPSASAAIPSRGRRTGAHGAGRRPASPAAPRQEVGALTVEARSPEERFTRAELQLLDDLAAQTGPAVSRRCWRRTCSEPVSASCSPGGGAPAPAPGPARRIGPRSRGSGCS